VCCCGAMLNRGKLGIVRLVIVGFTEHEIGAVTWNRSVSSRVSLPPNQAAVCGGGICLGCKVWAGCYG
jgi:hypothetical protein